MKKKLLFLFLPIVFTVLILIFIKKPFVNFACPETTLLNLFRSSGAKVVSSEMYFCGRVGNNNYKSFDELKKLVADFSKELGIPEDDRFSYKIIHNDMVKEIQLSGVIPGSISGSDRVVSITAYSAENPKEPDDNYISVDIIQDLTITEFEITRRCVEQVFRRHKIKPDVNSCITGSFEGKLSQEEMDDICRMIFKGADAMKIDGIKDSNLISVTAYSPSIRSYIKVRDNRVNLNIAIRYNSYEDKTYLWLATPVITTEY